MILNPIEHIKLEAGKKIYFASDNHLGAPDAESSLPREKKFVRWLNEIQDDAAAIFLLGDLFDFWFEYKHVVPKGFVRTLGKLAELRDKGIPIYFFVGNHDLWMRDYFEKELDIPVYYDPKFFKIGDKDFFIGHGDGKGPEDKGYKRMKRLFTNPVAKWFFRWLHPDIGVALGHYFSIKNKLISGDEDHNFLGAEDEWLVQYAERKLEEQNFDYFIFGHRHLPMKVKLSNAKSYYYNLGDWIQYYTYASFDGEILELHTFESDDNSAIIECL